MKIRPELFCNGKVEMPKITIDDLEFNTEDLCDEGKEELARLQVIELQMAKLKNELSIYKTARNSYARKLKKELNAIDVPVEKKITNN